MSERDGGPAKEGREAAHKGIPFADCPYTYGNSGARGMNEYANSGFSARRDAWFRAWSSEREAMLAERAK